jgi:hypothetical protein
VVTQTTQFTHLPSLAFCIVPQGMIHRSASSHFLELREGPFQSIFQGLITDKQSVVLAVKSLLRPSRGGRKDNFIEVNTINDEHN